MAKFKKRRGKIKVRQSARIVQKNDATRVSFDTLATRRMNAQMPRNAGATFRVKLRKK